MREVVDQVVSAVNGARVVDRLEELAAFNGREIPATEGHPHTHFATNRPVLSEADVAARHELIGPWMQQAGLAVEHHPLGVIGRLQGRNSREAPIIILSHVDSVSDGDMYDGTLGVTAGIETVDTMLRLGVQPERDVLVGAVTGEESEVFKFPLIGSRSWFQGLTDRELAATNAAGVSLGEVLGDQAAQVTEPLFGEGGPYRLPSAAIELHVEQSDSLEKKGVQIGLVEGIAAPERYALKIGGRPLQPDLTDYAHRAFYRLTVAGKANHSGMTPMDPTARADGLLALANLLHEMSLGTDRADAVTIGDITVEQGSINKVPGLTTANLRIAGDDALVVQSTLADLHNRIGSYNGGLHIEDTGFDDDPFSLTEIPAVEAGQFFAGDDMRHRQIAAFEMIRNVNSIVRGQYDAGVVGTVGTFVTNEQGQIELGVDIRGTNLAVRERVVGGLRELAKILDYAEIELGEPLAGSGEPVVMNHNLLNIASVTVARAGMTTEVMPCLAGHDIQNLVRAGVPGLLMLCQSNNGGLAHNPEAYTADEHITAGTKALAAVATQLSTAARLF